MPPVLSSLDWRCCLHIGQYDLHLVQQAGVWLLLFANKVLNPQDVFQNPQWCCAYPLKWVTSLDAYVQYQKREMADKLCYNNDLCKLEKSVY